MGHQCTHWVKIDSYGNIQNYFHTETSVDMDVWLKDWPQGTQIVCLESYSPRDASDIGNRRKAWRFDSVRNELQCINPRPEPKIESSKPTVEEQILDLQNNINKIITKLGIS